MTDARRKEIENALLTCGDAITLPVADVADLLRGSKAQDLYARRLRILEAERDDASPVDDTAYLDVDAQKVGAK